MNAQDGEPTSYQKAIGSTPVGELRFSFSECKNMIIIVFIKLKR